MHLSPSAAPAEKPRRKRRLRWIFAATALIMIVLGCAVGPDTWRIVFTNPAITVTYPSQSVNGSFVDTSASPPVVHLYGSPYERGYAHGALLREGVAAMLDNYLDIAAKYTGGYERYERAAALMRDSIPVEYLDEMRGVADGAGIDLGRILAANVFLDVSQTLGCSTFTVDAGRCAPDEGPLLARNLDFMDLNIAGRMSVIMVHHRADGQDVAAVTWPGLIGAVSGMNENGLSLAMMLVLSNASVEKGIPYPLIYRRVLEEARDANAARERLGELARHTTCTTNVTVLDREGASFVAELEPGENGTGRALIRKAEAGVAFSTNHFCADHGERVKVRAFKNSHTRMETLAERLSGPALETRPMTLDEAKALLRNVAVAGPNLQSMVFLPRRRELILSAGDPPAVEGEYARHDFAAYFAARAR